MGTSINRYIYMYIYRDNYIYIYKYTDIYMNAYMYIYIHIHVCIDICTYIYIYIHTYVYMCVYIYIYTHLKVLSFLIFWAHWGTHGWAPFKRAPFILWAIFQNTNKQLVKALKNNMSIYETHVKNIWGSPVLIWERREL